MTIALVSAQIQFSLLLLQLLDNSAEMVDRQPVTRVSPLVHRRQVHLDARVDTIRPSLSLSLDLLQ